MKQSKMLIQLSLIAVPSAILHGQVPLRVPSPPSAGVKAPQLSDLTEKQVLPILKEAQHCELRVGNSLRLVASEQGRYAVAVINGAMSALLYEGRNPIRNGGRFLASPVALDVWVSVQPREDKSLAIGLPRHVSVMVNGIDGGSDAYPGTYVCNY